VACRSVQKSVLYNVEAHTNKRDIVAVTLTKTGQIRSVSSVLRGDINPEQSRFNWLSVKEYSGIHETLVVEE